MTDWERKAQALLVQAAHMLRLEAEEWRTRQVPDKAGRSRAQMLKIAEANEGMAQAMIQHANQILEDVK